MTVLRKILGRILQWLRVPGFVGTAEYRDPESGDLVLKIRTSPRYTIIEAAGREFYFLRESGKFDGTGAMSLDDPLPINGLLADRTRRGSSREEVW